MRRVKLSDIIAPHFYELHRDIKEHRHTYYWLEGGRGSTKSSDISIEIPQILIKNPDCHAVVLRKVGNTIKTSVYPQIQWGIDALGLSGKFKFKTSPHEITYKKTGQKILFFGVDAPERLSQSSCLLAMSVLFGLRSSTSSLAWKRYETSTSHFYAAVQNIGSFALSIRQNHKIIG